MPIVLAVLACIFALFGLGAAGLHAGFRAGDQPADADVKVDGSYQEGEAVVSVLNPHPAAALVSCSSTPAGIFSLVAPPVARSTTWRHRMLTRHDTLLGAVEGHSSNSWVIPVPFGDAHRAAKVTVRVEQAGGRTRLHKHVVSLTDRLSDTVAELS